MEDIEMRPITTEEKTSSLSKEEILNKQIEDVKGVMNDNVAKVLDNIDLTDELQNKTEAMKVLSEEFSITSKKVKRRIWYKNIRINICISLLVISVFYYIYDSVK
tara:strand:+ start:47 stop:361 length:315 start_codon:yes stop_codon:yes gene_type:complete